MQNEMGTKVKVNQAIQSVYSWFNNSRLVVVTKPVRELRDDAHLVKEFCLGEREPAKWENMKKLFRWRFGETL